MAFSPAATTIALASLAATAVSSTMETAPTRRRSMFLEWPPDLRLPNVCPPQLHLPQFRMPRLLCMRGKDSSGPGGAQLDDPAAIVSEATSSSDEWVLRVDRAGVRVWQRSVEGSPNDEVRASGIIRAPPHRVLALMQDGDEEVSRLYNPMYGSGRDLEEIDADTKVSYGTSRAIFPFAPRDTVTRVAKRELPAPIGGSALLMQPVTHPDAPPQSGFVRARVVRGIFLMQPVPHNPGLTNFTFAQQIDVGGLIPAWLMNRIVAQDAVNLVQRVGTAAGGRQTRLGGSAQHVAEVQPKG
jgi:hypothetical protein